MGRGAMLAEAGWHPAENHPAGNHPPANRAVLLGRRAGRAAIDRLLARVRAACSGALVARGEAGIGKIMLLRYARDTGSGFRVEHAAGVESEADFAFAGLHQLCAPLLGRAGAGQPGERARRALAAAHAKHGPVRPTPPRSCWRSQRPDRSTRCTTPGSTCYAPRSRLS